MIRYLKYILTITLLALISLSCKRQKIYEPEYLTANIPIVMDWSESSVKESDINNVSIYFYPSNGAAPIMVYSNDPYFVTASLPEGIYDIVIHNEMEGNIKGVDCTGSDIFGNHKMHIQYDDASKYDMFYTPQPGEQLIKESEAIGAWSYEQFEVTRDMIEYTRTRSFEDMLVILRSRSQARARALATKTEEEAEAETRAYVEDLTRSLTKAFDDSDPATRTVTRSLEDLNGVKPQPRTANYKVIVDIQNMNNIQYIEGVIDGFADGAEVVSGAKIASANRNFTFMLMSEHAFNEGSTTDGRMWYDFTNFGHLQSVGGEKYTLTINIVIHSGEKFTFVFDVTDQVNKLAINGVLEIRIGDYYDNGTTDIVLPENKGAGFGVSDWGPAEDVEL